MKEDGRRTAWKYTTFSDTVMWQRHKYIELTIVNIIVNYLHNIYIIITHINSKIIEGRL